MIIERVQAENVLKYARLDLDEIPTQGLIAVIGDNESGKSSIGESICFALFGRTFSLGPDELGKVIRWGESRCAIKLDFRTPDGTRYQVARFLDELGNHGASISRPGEQPMVRGVEAVALRLRDLIGFGYTELIESFYLAQREISTPKPHSDAVKAMAGIDALERVGTECRRERGHTEALRAGTAREHAEAMAQIQALGLDPVHLTALGADQAQTQAALASDRGRILALKSKVEAVDGAITRTKEEAAIWGAVEPTASYAERQTQAARLNALLTAVAPACAGDSAVSDAHKNLAGVARAMADRLAGLDVLRRQAGTYRDRLAAQLGMVEPATAAPVLGPEVANATGGLGSAPVMAAVTTFATLIQVQDRRVARARHGRRRSRAWGLGAALLGLLLAVAWVLLAEIEPGTPAARLAGALDGLAADWRRALPWLPVATGALGLLAIGLLARGTQLARRLVTEAEVRAGLERDRQAAEQEHADLGHLENRPLPEALALLARLKDEAITGAVSALMAGPEGDLLDAGRLGERRREFKSAATGLIASLTRIKAETDQAIDTLHDAVAQHAAEIASRNAQIAQEQGRVRRHAELIAIAEGLRARGEALAHRLRVRDLATDLLAGAIHYISQRFNTEVRNLCADSLPKFTNGRYQHLRIDQDLKVKAFSNEKHDFMDLDEISSGTQRQIMLAVRLALSQKLVNSVIQGPQFVFLDEPFAFFDESRTASALAVLPQVSRDFTQIWVTSQTFPAASRFDLVVECSARESQSPRIRRPDQA
jgi:hypothetical protein